MRRNPRILVYSAGDRDATTVEAATRAGALGVLDLAWVALDGWQEASTAVRRVAHRSDQPFAIRVNTRDLTPEWLISLPPTASTIITVATTIDGQELPGAIDRVARSGRGQFARSRRPCRSGRSVGPDRRGA